MNKNVKNIYVNTSEDFFYNLIIIHLVIVHAHKIYEKHQIKMTKNKFYFNEYK